IRAEGAAKNERLAALDLDLAEQIKHGMIRWKAEFRGDDALLRAGADKPRIGARAERERKAVKEDGFPRPCLSGQDAQPIIEGKIEPVDQNDIADGEYLEHIPARLKDSFPRLHDPRIFMDFRPQIILVKKGVGILIPVAAREVVAEDGRRRLRFIID